MRKIKVFSLIAAALLLISVFPVSVFATGEPEITISMSEPASLDDEFNTVTATVSIENNPGLWALSFYLYYDPSFTVTDAAAGVVFGGEGEAIYEARNFVVSNDPTAKAIFEASGVSTAGRLALCYYADSSTLDNDETNGTVLTVTFKYAADLEGNFSFGFAYNPESVINSSCQNVDVIFSAASFDFEPISVAVLVGDVNGDGMLGIKDISDLKKYLAGGLSESQVAMQNCDINIDGLISIKDIGAIKKLMA